MTPGAYLARRREAAGRSVADVAARLSTAPRLAEHARAELIALIEADEAPARFETIVALRSVFPFDLDVLTSLSAIALGVTLPMPLLCTRCACSHYDPCDDDGPGAGVTCAWTDQDPPLCTVCASDSQSGHRQPDRPDHEGAAA